MADTQIGVGWKPDTHDTVESFYEENTHVMLNLSFLKSIVLR